MKLIFRKEVYMKFLNITDSKEISEKWIDMCDGAEVIKGKAVVDGIEFEICPQWCEVIEE